jgi:hypothetical protein
VVLDFGQQTASGFYKIPIALRHETKIFLGYSGSRVLLYETAITESTIFPGQARNIVALRSPASLP